MAEPAASTAGIAIAAGTITLTGSILGVQYDLLLAGFFGGLVALQYLPTMPRARLAGSVVSSTLIAGWFAPIAAAGASHYFPWVADATGAAVRMAAAAALGLCAQVIIPVALTWLRKRGEAQP